ncbi:TPA: hypothetical protein N0F65_011448 [Lagenidium giganteum]|uniref:peptidylprolyl isomerase n=1 Tax=Lagenidium giganteum TaxID=4803 RepID=A0AAV2Z9W4_9STRA|nr:TPA: hypothetical protein N0F65_011448 [Lagenidium giganteum]
MRVAVVLLGVLAAVGTASAAKTKEDLPPNAQLRIGVKFRPEKCEQKSEPGDKLSMHYTGTLRKDGSKFDSSVDRGTPFEFKLGAGQVIKGWDQGEKRRLTIPSGMGYGDHGSPPKIPGKATLVFDVELMKITRPKDDL